MPLAVRYVQPKKVCYVPLVDPASGANSLQALNLQSVSGVIRQLSSLARHAESIMGDIADMLASYYVRTVALEERSKRLMTEILPALDPDQEVLEGFEILHPSSQYRSNRRTDQQLLTQQQWPTGLAEQYEAADKTPALQFFTPLREDGNNAMIFFSNPEFFFEHWRVNIQQQMMRRKTNPDLLSPTPGDGERKPNGVVKSQKTRKASAGVRRSSSLKRSFKKRVDTFHGSTLSLEGAGKSKRSTLAYRSFRVPTEPPLRFRQNLSRSFRYSFRRKSKHVAKLGMLTKATATAFEGQDIPLPRPDLTEEKRDVHSPEEKTKSSLVRRSFSFRTTRDRQSRSRSPNPPIPSSSVCNGMQMHTLETAKEKQETSVFSALSKRHLENLDLGVTDFETCLTLDSSRKNSSTFKVPEIIRSRPVSPFLFGNHQQKSARRQPPSPPKVLPKPVMTSSDKVLPRERGRSATVSGAGGSEMKQVAVRLRKHLSAVMDRSTTPPILRPTSSQSSFPVFPPSPAFQRSHSPLVLSNSQVDPPALTRVRSGSMNSNGNARGKPRRPAPPQPNRPGSLSRPEGSSAGTTPSPTPSSSSIPPPPPVRSDSISSGTTKRLSHHALSEISQTEAPAATGFEPVNLTTCPGRMESGLKDNSVPIGSLSEAQSMQPPGDSLVSVPALRTAPYPNPLAISEMPNALTPPRNSLVSAGVQTTPSLYLSQSQARQSPPNCSLVSAGAQTTASLYLSEAQSRQSPPNHSLVSAGAQTTESLYLSEAQARLSPPNHSPVSAGAQTTASLYLSEAQSRQSPHNHSLVSAGAETTASPYLSQNSQSPGPSLIPGSLYHSDFSQTQALQLTSPPPISGSQSSHAFSPPLVSGFQAIQMPNRSVVLSPPPPPTVSFTSLPKSMLRKDSLYISPRKQSIIALIMPVDIEESVEEDANKRSSRILKAGGVGNGDVDITNTRSNFLVAIQTGIQLRKVQRQGTEEDKTDPWDVAAILERRLAIMDSDSEEESEEDTDDSDWDK